MENFGDVKISIPDSVFQAGSPETDPGPAPAPAAAPVAPAPDSGEKPNDQPQDKPAETPAPAAEPTAEPILKLGDQEYILNDATKTMLAEAIKDHQNRHDWSVENDKRAARNAALIKSLAPVTPFIETLSKKSLDANGKYIEGSAAEMVRTIIAEQMGEETAKQFDGLVRLKVGEYEDPKDQLITERDGKIRELQDRVARREFMDEHKLAKEDMDAIEAVAVDRYVKSCPKDPDTGETDYNRGTVALTYKDAMDIWKAQKLLAEQSKPKPKEVPAQAPRKTGAPAATKKVPDRMEDVKITIPEGTAFDH